MKYIFLFIFHLVVLQSFAVEVINGVVLDKETEQPLPFASIGIAGQPRGTIANVEGHFALDISGTQPTDSLLFSHIGYKTLRIAIKDIGNQQHFYLSPAAINLLEVQVSSRPLAVEEILKLVKDNYPKNYPKVASKQRIFYHRYETAPFPEENKIILKKSNFVGMDRKTFDSFYDKIPKEFTEYQDALFDLYYDGDDEHKLIPIQGVSLEEGSMEDLTEEMEKLLGSFFEDIEKTNLDKDTYYKFKTGVFGVKVGKNEVDSSFSQEMGDSINYHISTDFMCGSVRWVTKNYSQLDSKNWEFVKDLGKYEYELKDLTIFNDELVYEIGFTPKKRGLFKGTMFISTRAYAILQMEFEYDENKSTENFNLLGFGHSMKYKKGRVIYEKGTNGYFVKYIYALQNETGSVDRSFTILKKERRFLIDKELNEIKFDAELEFDMTNYWEMLVLDREEFDASKFTSIKQPKIMKFKKEYAYTPDMWNNRTIIVPTAELKKYERSQVSSN